MKKLLLLLTLFSTVALAADKTVGCLGASCKVVFETRDGSNVKANSTQFTYDPAIFMYVDSSSSYVIKTQKTVVTSAGATDVFRFLKNGSIYGNNAISGTFYVTATDSSTGGNAYTGMYTILTTGDGTTNSKFQIQTSQPANADQSRGTNPATSFSLANDGGSGAVKLQFTRSAITSVDVRVTFVGIVRQ
jgi:hypothetical protein